VHGLLESVGCQRAVAVCALTPCAVAVSSHARPLRTVGTLHYWSVPLLRLRLLVYPPTLQASPSPQVVAFVDKLAELRSLQPLHPTITRRQARAGRQCATLLPAVQLCRWLARLACTVEPEGRKHSQSSIARTAIPLCRGPVPADVPLLRPPLYCTYCTAGWTSCTAWTSGETPSCAPAGMRSASTQVGVGTTARSTPGVTSLALLRQSSPQQVLHVFWAPVLLPSGTIAFQCKGHGYAQLLYVETGSNGRRPSC